MTTETCEAITRKKRRCQHKPYATTGSYIYLELAGRLPNAERRCTFHLTAEDKALISRVTDEREAVRERVWQVDPACWSWAVTDHVRALLAQSESASETAPRQAGILLFEALRVYDGDRCAICGGAGNDVEDHDHVTGLVRGWLCRYCNIQEGKQRGGHDDVWARYRKRPPYVILGIEERYWDPFTNDWAPDITAELAARDPWRDNPMRGVGL